MPTPCKVYKRVQKNRPGSTIPYQRPNTVFRMIPKKSLFLSVRSYKCSHTVMCWLSLVNWIFFVWSVAYKCDPQCPVCVSNEKTTKLTHEIKIFIIFEICFFMKMYRLFYMLFNLLQSFSVVTVRSIVPSWLYFC